MRNTQSSYWHRLFCSWSH